MELFSLMLGSLITRERRTRYAVLSTVAFYFSFLFFSRDRTRWTNQRKLKVSPCLYLLYSRLFILLLLRSFYFSFFLSLSFSSATFSFSFILISSIFPFPPYARKCSYFSSFPLILFICLLV